MSLYANRSCSSLSLTLGVSHAPGSHRMSFCLDACHAGRLRSRGSAQHTINALFPLLNYDDQLRLLNQRAVDVRHCRAMQPVDSFGFPSVFSRVLTLLFLSGQTDGRMDSLTDRLTDCLISQSSERQHSPGPNGCSLMCRKDCVVRR